MMDIIGAEEGRGKQFRMEWGFSGKNEVMGCLLIAGGTGLLGKQFIKQEGHRFSEIRLLSRTAGSTEGHTQFVWDPATGKYDPRAFIEVDYILNLAGAGIADKSWTTKRREEIISSRVNSLKTLLKAVRETGAHPKLVLSASATGYYGNRGDELVDEDAAPGTSDSFLASTCMQWEEAAAGFERAGYPLAILRIGIVLSADGGALPKLLLPLKARVSGYFGNGSQYVPWIHIVDIVAMMAWIFEGQRTGVWNGVAPAPVTSKQLAQALAKAKGGWITASVPAFALKLAMGAMSETVLTGARVQSEKALLAGFDWQFVQIGPALEDLL
jgi:uncharacterized protein (TIGR01777 family)